MTYLALARKWRPQRFEQIVGQPHVVQALTHALTQNRIHHAYLFTGTHGIGKTTLARIFAKCLNCETGITATPCEKCSNCEEINSGRFPDLFEIDAASRTKVEDTRELLDNIPYAPTKGKFKVYLIDEVHMLSGHSFNALLKTLEEPPAHVKFLLATTDPQKLPATVLSRCLQFHLAKMTPEQIDEQLAHILKAEKIKFEQDALALISESANGSMRDALSLLDQCIAYGNGEIKKSETQAMLGLSNQAEITALIKAIHLSDAETVLSLTKKWASIGAHFANCLSEMLTQLYQLTVIQALEKSPFHNTSAELKNLAAMISREDVQLYYQIALMGKQDLPLAPTAQIGFEMVALRMIAFHPGVKNTEKKTVVKVEKTTKTPEKSSNWDEILNSLGLTGPTLALAQHCALRTLTQNELQLVLHPKYAALSNPRQLQRIQDAMTAYAGGPVKVNIRVEENQLETPADIALTRSAEKKESTKRAIASDAAVQRIVKTFDATVIDE